MSRIKIEMPENYRFSVSLPVRISDINYGGHLGNDALLAMVHEARVQFLRHYHYSEQDIEGVGLVMTDSAIVYKAEAFHGDLIQIEVAIGGFNKYGCDFHYLLSHKNTAVELAHAKTGVVCFDYNKRKIVAMPAAFKECFLKEL
jgi:YbgC/YbaW family acyl-CoA thioester hydrolase